jgi:NMD protein affecting ribosome stability and mRNA decay
VRYSFWEVRIITKKGIKFCIDCGAKNVPIIEHLCMDCYIKKNPLIKKKGKKFTFKICKECFNYYHRHWIRPKSTEFREFLHEIIDTELDSFLKIQPNVEINYQYDISMDLLWSNRKFILEIEAHKFFPEFDAELNTYLELEIKISV